MPAKKNPLTSKVGPAPLWVWVAAAAGLYLAYRAFAGRSQTAPAQTTQPAPSDLAGGVSGGGLSGGGGGSFAGDSGATGGATAPPSAESAFAAYSDILAQLEGQNAQLLGGLLQQGLPGSVSSTTGGGTGGGGAAFLGPPTPAPTGGVIGVDVNASGHPYGPGHYNKHTLQPPAASVTVQAEPQRAGKAYLAVAEPVSAPPSALPQFPISAANPNFAQAAQQATVAYAAAGKPAPFGGVVSVRTLANGSTLTTYASGRQVQQVPGKSAYVVHA